MFSHESASAEVEYRLDQRQGKLGWMMIFSRPAHPEVSTVEAFFQATLVNCIAVTMLLAIVFVGRQGIEERPPSEALGFCSQDRSFFVPVHRVGW
jgi:hypothetical protein